MLVTSLPRSRAITSARRRPGSAWRCCARARSPVTPSSACASRLARRDIVQRALPASARDEVLHVRARMERELAQESAARRDFNVDAAACSTCENAVQYLQLRHGGEAWRPARGRRNRRPARVPGARRLARRARRRRAAARLGFPAKPEQSPARGREPLHLRSRHRTRRPRRRGQNTWVSGWHTRRCSAARALLADYRSHTEAIRAAYERILGHTHAR